MNIFLTLDYEIYFGRTTGTVRRSIIEATDMLLEVLDRYNVKAVFFVDIGFVKRLEELKDGEPSLQSDYKLLTEHMYRLSENGHDLQLHIHPHWESSEYINGSWEIDADKYRLEQFSDQRISEIISNYKNLLTRFCGNNEVFAYRAGGWCIQPFGKIKEGLIENDIWLDSTIYQGGFQNDYTHKFDFRNAPELSKWKFEDDPLNPNEHGYFTEIPISSIRVSPLFFWKFAFSKLGKSKVHKPFGDGVSLPTTKKWILNKLLFPSNSVVSMDGYKASLLQKAFKNHQKNKSNKDFVIIGHPKALTEFSLSKLNEFISDNHKSHNFHTFTSLLEMGKIKGLE